MKFASDRFPKYRHLMKCRFSKGIPLMTFGNNLPLNAF